LSRARRATGFLCYGLAPPMSDAGGGGVYGWARFPSDAGGRVLNLQALQGCCGRRCLSIHPRWSVGSNQKLSSTPMHHPKPPYVPHGHRTGVQVARLVWHLHHLHPSAGELANDAVIGGGEVVGVRAVACGGWREAVLVEGFSKGAYSTILSLHQSVLSQKTPKDQLPHAYLAPPPAYPKRIFSQPALSLAQPRSHPNDPPSLPSTQRHLDSPPRCLWGWLQQRISPACHLERHAEPSKLDAVLHTIHTDIALTSPPTGRAPPPL
jgi:hypothetical protein